MQYILNNLKRFFSSKDTRGITMLEVIVVMAILGIVSIGASTLIIQAIRSNDVIWEQLTTQSEGRRVLHNIINDVRKAEESSVGSFPLVTVGENELTVYSNIDSDSLRERVRYWLDGTTIKRGIIKPSGNPLSYIQAEDVDEIAHNVKNIEQEIPLFTYFGEDYTGTQTALEQPVTMTDVRMIQIQLELEKNADKTPVPLHLETIFHVRNLKTN